ncbi:hypothetical protein [Oleidesulfovibrio sp.]|uniref:hypothetical protein n=1 Tax=Oleidesulfovibrio sp. TaxID=2909707 RepID=UPI003A8C8037
MRHDKAPQHLLENIGMQENDKGNRKNTISPALQKMINQVRRAIELDTQQQPYLQSDKVNVSFDGSGTRRAIEEGLAAITKTVEEQCSRLSPEQAESLNSIDVDMKLVPEFSITTSVNKPVA